MTTTFQYRLYAKDNADLAERFGVEDADRLQTHFQRFGQSEMRGVTLSDYMRIEGVMLSDEGHLFISGWADRRVIRTISISIELGYLRYDLGTPEMLWFHRADVAQVTGDTSRPAGFMLLTKLADFTPHARLRLLINDKAMHEAPVMRLMSAAHFLDQALGASAQLADQPAGITLPHAQALYPFFADLWREVLDGMTFINTFEHRAADETRQSVIITIYREADMLLVQLALLARELIETGTEVIVVGNDLLDANRLMEELAAFCQIHPVDLSVWLCSGNSGFSRGNNFGASKARSDVLIFMNPDIFPPEEDDGSTARAFLSGDPGEALHGALLYYGDGMLMHSGMYTTSDVVFDTKSGERREIMRVEHFGKGLSHRIGDLDLGPVLRAIEGRDLLVSAALWKIRRDVFVAVGRLPEDYIFAYYEDADFCLQLLRQGYRIELDTTSRWLHMEGVGKPKPPSVRSFMWLNRAFYTQRFLGDPLVAGADTDLTQL